MNVDSAAHDEVIAYFSGRYHGEMGLKSHLGPLLEYQTQLQRSPTVPMGPPDAALQAARTASRVEETLLELSVEERAILAAAYRPHGPWAPDGLRVLKDVATVACLLQDPDEIRKLVRASHSKKNPHRKEAAKEVRRIEARARRALAAALAAYRAAAEHRRKRRRLERRQRITKLAMG